MDPPSDGVVATEEVAAPIDPPEAAPRSRWDRHTLALVGILLLAAVLRGWNLDWDDGTHLHPDERFWSIRTAAVQMPAEGQSWTVLLDTDESPMNPRNHGPNYVYGTLPLFASKGLAAVMMTENMSWLNSALDTIGIDLVRDGPEPVHQRLLFNSGYDAEIIGRLLSVLVDTATVFVVYRLGCALRNRRVGLLAAFLQALTVLHIQYSHFLGSEPWVAFFVTGAVLGLVRILQGEAGWRTRVATAVAVGAAVGVKLSGVAVFAAVGAAILVALLPELRRLRVERPTMLDSIQRLLGASQSWILLLLGSVVSYRIVQPYDFNSGFSLIFHQRFEDDVSYLNDVNSGGNWPWVHPLVDAQPLWHPIKQMVLWGMGPGLGLAAIAGLLLAMNRVRRGEHVWAVPVAVVLGYFVLVSLQFYAIIRYLQPAYPVLTVFGASAILAAWQWGVAHDDVRRGAALAARGAAVVAVGATAFWGLAFVNGVYGQDNARIAASEWVVENLPAGSKLSAQEWDDSIPWGRPGDFEIVPLRPWSFGGDSPEGIEDLIRGLDQVDYVIESSNKFYDSLPRTPARFPQITEYYERLFDGSLGFERIRTFRNQPSLLGIEIDDSGAEEAFTVYDHPTVIVWQKTPDFSVERASALLNPDRARTAINVLPKDAAANAAMLEPAAYETQQSGSSFSDVHTNSSTGLMAVIQWLLAIQIAALATAPFVLRYGGRGAGVSYGLTKIGGLIALGLPVWLLVGFGVVEFSAGLVWFVLVVLVVAAARFSALNLVALRAAWARHRRRILQTEALFLAVFVFMVLMRLINPDVWHPGRGGEKPMELAYFTAVAGSTTFPPYDPWFAGGSLNYYFGGWLFTAVPTRMLGLLPSVGFNLSVVTYATLAATTIWSTAGMLVKLAGHHVRSRISAGRAGALAVVLFLVIGNLDGFRQVVARLRGDRDVNPFDWWDPSRVIKDSPGIEVTEFPNFTVLFADLHPHFMGMPFFGLTIGVVIAYIERCRQGRSNHTWVLAALIGLLTGLVSMIHTWDLPTVLAMGAGAVATGALLASGPIWWRIRAALGHFVVLGIAHLVVSAPYRSANQAADSGVHAAESHTNLDDWIAHFGLFLFVAIVYLGSRLWATRRFDQATIFAGLFGLLGMVLLHVVIGSVAAWAFVGLVASMLVAWRETQARLPSTALVVVASCWMLGFGILTVVELVTMNVDIQRLNTVFKFWLQVWHLFALASAFATMWLLSGAAQRWRAVHGTVTDNATDGTVASHDSAQGAGIGTGPVANSLASPTDERDRTLASAFRGGLGLLLIASLIYPVLAVAPRQADRIDRATGLTLDGRAWLEPGTTTLGVKNPNGEWRIDPGRDRAIMEWLRANVDGRPTIVEGVGDLYSWWSRMSVHTGLPTVLGWDWHQRQQRSTFAESASERYRDVLDFWVTEDPVVIDQFLRAYDVSYVIVGSLEEASANSVTLDLLAANPSLVQVWRGDGRLAIYEVQKGTLAESRGPIAVAAPG